ncbi:type III-B CRISPR module RAMP protein Cmr1, partial [Thermogutta sp.]|uniref:type III-B CRISPR module RAMP protein Cmr1 n=1 Tax=Thermogutta sp. TaxID=1962930 RepID=UPI00321F9AD0
MKDMKEWKLKALTDIWTGDADQSGDRLIPTGLIGSIRWWFEVLVRGLGGKACDPAAPPVRCPDREGKHCVVCELFGCTGWARKFRLMVLAENGQVIQNLMVLGENGQAIQNQIQAGQIFTLRFLPLRPIRDEEWCLLDATLRLIADYGAIGGKT